MGVPGIKTASLLTMLLAAPMAGAAIVEFHDDGFTRQVAATGAQKLALDWASIGRLYAQFDGRPLWHTGESLNPLGRRLQAWLDAADGEGLESADYHRHPLRRLAQETGADARSVRELLLTDGYLRLAADLRQGSRTARALDPFTDGRRAAFDPVAALVEALGTGRLDDLLTGLGPSSAPYRRLQRALTHYREIEAAGGWPRLEAANSLRPGQRGPLISRLRERLALEAGRPVESAGDPEIFDADLQAELRRFQRRHGLAADGVAGPATIEALNVPVAGRIAQLRINLERWRWLPHEMADEHLLVNTAGFDLAYQARDRVLFSGRTVNGSETHPTPPMITRITHLVANPPWTVPRRIAVEEMLPRQQADPGYLTRKGFRVLRRAGDGWEAFDPATVDWSRYHADNFPFVLRQDAGAGNSLGRVKFHMPNDQAIYLHDTPAVGLFDRSDRALSSGCVRIEGAEKLARQLLGRADPWEAGKFSLALERGETLITPLREPLPVYLVYFTSWVDEAGEVHFRPDIYRRDADLMMAIGGAQRRATAQHTEDSQPGTL